MTAVVERPQGLRGRLRPVVRLARPWRSYLRYGVASGIFQQVLFIAGAAIVAYIVGRAVLGASYNGLVFYLLGLVVIVLLQVRTPWLESISCQFIANHVQVELRTQIFDALARLTPAGLAGRRSGDLGSAVMGDVGIIQRFFAETLSTLIVASVAPLLAVVALAALSWPLALLLVPFVALAASVPVWLHGRAQRQGSALRDELAELSAEVVDDVQGLREILTFGAESAIRADLDRRGQRAAALQAVQARRGGTEKAAAELIATVGTLAVVGVGAMLAAHHDLSRTFVPPAVVLAALSFGPIVRLVDAAKGLGELAAAGERVFSLLGTPIPVVDGIFGADGVEEGRVGESGPVAACVVVEPGPVVVTARPGVEYSDVRFRYRPDLPLAVDGVTFAVDAGETVALAGHAGAGKSTCMNLLLRFWDVEAGCVAVGGVDVRNMPQAELHRLVGLVSQDVYLFNASIRENLRLGQPDAGDTEIEAAARATAAWEFVVALPDGLDTGTGERGVQLSGGQRQRLAIARAFLVDPPILVLDEPVSNLDTENERAVTEAMSRLRQGRTTLIVAHRLSTIKAADRVVVLEKGRVAETGTHAELMANGHTYRDLVASQLS